MAYGAHWEWRGFGELDAAVRAVVEALPPVDPEPRTITDRYVWHPGLTLNIKLRSSALGERVKIKRLLEEDRTTALGRWLEDPVEDYAFPLHASAIRKVAGALGLGAPLPARLDDAPALESLLTRAHPGLRLVTVEKVRRGYLWGRPGLPVTVELAEITAPERVTSLGLEDATGLSPGADREAIDTARRAVEEVRDTLGIGRALRACSYVDAVAVWVEGGSLKRRW